MSNKIEDMKEQKINIIKNYKTNYEPIDKNAFAKYIRERRKEYNEEKGEELSTEDLGNIIGINYEMFRKILNQEKPTKKRDCIIAICVALQLLRGEIDEALGLYNYMPALDENNPREGFIISQISGDPISVQELNNRLIQWGFPGLDVQDRRNGNKDLKIKPVDLPYRVVNLKVSTPIDTDYYYGDQYNSLCTTYDPFRCKSIGEMIIEDFEQKKCISLTADTDGYKSVSIIKDDVSLTDNSSGEIEDYNDFFIELDNAINIEKKRLLNILNDTKNYKSRTSARLIDDAIMVFTEQFNYSVPELNEYYVLCLSSGHYKLYVYDCSAFMTWYLSEEMYEKYYGIERPKYKEQYDSLDQLQRLMNGSNKNDDEYNRYRMRQKAFKKLMIYVDELYKKIRNREEFIQNLNYIYDNPIDVLKYYKIEEDFECKYDDEYGEICSCLDSKEYNLLDGRVIQITLDDIFKAFEFGFPSIEEICRIKAKYGSIGAVL